MKNLLCKIGIHRWNYCEAPWFLMGQEGVIRAKVCKKCKYKSSKGEFIPRKKI